MRSDGRPQGPAHPRAQPGRKLDASSTWAPEPVGLPAQPGLRKPAERCGIDGTVFPWDPVHSYKLAEVLELSPRGSGLYGGRSISSWAGAATKGLTAELRGGLIDEASGDALIPRVRALVE